MGDITIGTAWNFSSYKRHLVSQRYTESWTPIGKPYTHNQQEVTTEDVMTLHPSAILRLRFGNLWGCDEVGVRRLAKNHAWKSTLPLLFTNSTCLPIIQITSPPGHTSSHGGSGGSSMKPLPVPDTCEVWQHKAVFSLPTDTWWKTVASLSHHSHVIPSHSIPDHSPPVSVIYSCYK